METEKAAAPRTPPGKRHGKSGLQTARDAELGNDHLFELEVDLDGVLARHDGNEGDFSADTSPFPAVRAVVPETDDTGMPVNTFRAWSLGVVGASPPPPPPPHPLRLTRSRSLSSSAPA